MRKFFLLLLPLVFLALSVSEAATGNELFLLNQDGKTDLGKISVYKFTLKDLRYEGGETLLSAVGTEYMAELYMTPVGSSSIFTISINGDNYAVVENPYNKKVSDRDYYAAWVLKDGKYTSAPKCTHKAGDYFLSLPFSNGGSSASDAKSGTKTNTSTSSSTGTKSSNTAPAKKELNWQMMGKVTLFRNQRINRVGEDSVVYDEEPAFLYSAMDGDRLVYRAYLINHGYYLSVSQNSHYTGAQVRWTSSGRSIITCPPIEQMYTHTAGSYYFNLRSVRN